MVNDVIRRLDFCCFMMASFFGEIIEPSTRAIFDDFSDDEDPTTDPELQLSWTNNDEKLPSVLDFFFIIHGRLSLAFAEAYLLSENSSQVAEINTENDKNTDRDIEFHHQRSLPSRIFLEKTVGYCLVSPSWPLEFGYFFTEAISPFLKISKKVIVLTNESLYSFKTLSLHELPPAFMTELSTTYSESQELAEALPRPNFIAGIPAGVLTWCQIFKKNCSAFICYTDQEKLDSVTALPYLSVLRKLSNDLIKTDNPDFNKKTFYGNPEIIGGSSNIYI